MHVLERLVENVRIDDVGQIGQFKPTRDEV
jgi:hypothetical protein